MDVFHANMAEFNLSKALEYILKIFYPLCKAKRIQIKHIDCSVDQELPTIVEGDERRFK